MTGWQRWLRQPQGVWLRKANFQIHLWAGIGVGIYIFVVCVTGSALVFRPEISRAMAGGQVLVAGSGTPLTDQQIREVIARTKPGYQVPTIYRGGKPNAGILVLLTNGSDERKRMLDPFTGEDIGPAVPLGMQALTWFLDLHDNLLGGETGRTVNGVGGILMTVLSVTGLVIWWPGIKNWSRSLWLHRGVNWKRVNWDLHSALGFWTFGLTFIWAVSGAYLVFQGGIQDVIDYLFPMPEGAYKPRLIDEILAWIPRLHFGRFRGLRPSLVLSLKIVWVVLGLAPAILFVTGAIMWWNRVLVNVDWGGVLATKKHKIPKETLNPDPS